MDGRWLKVEKWTDGRKWGEGGGAEGMNLKKKKRKVKHSIEGFSLTINYS